MTDAGCLRDVGLGSRPWAESLSILTSLLLVAWLTGSSAHTPVLFRSRGLLILGCLFMVGPSFELLVSQAVKSLVLNPNWGF